MREDMINAIHCKKFKYGKGMQRAISTRIFWIIMLIFLVPWIKAIAQTTLCKTFKFASGSATLTTKMNDSLDQLCKKTLSTKRGHIGITVWQNDDAESIQKTSLAESRMRNIFAYLIEKNCGNLVSEIRIKLVQTDSVMSTGMPAPENQIEFCILESFPDDSENDIILERIKNIIPGLLVREPDTIIRGTKGTLIKFSGESFKPYKLSDFRYEIDEIFTTEEIDNHNMSTMTTAGALITSFKAIRIWVTPINPEIPLPETMAVRATLLIPFDSTINNLINDNMLAFRPGKGSKPFVTWNKSGDRLHMELFGGRNYFYVQTDVMGYLAIGKLNQSRKTWLVQIPRFSKIKITIRVDSAVALAIFQEPDHGIIRLTPSDSHPDGKKDFFITAEGVDGSGNLYLLKQTILERFANKKKMDYFVLRKKDFQKIKSF